MSNLYNRIETLCRNNKITITTMCKESGASRASLSDLKVGRKQNLSTETLDKIADYFNTTVDYLMGRTNDPINYDNDGDALAEIPLSYVEACNGDLSRAHAMMLAVDEENLAHKEKLTQESELDTSEEMLILNRAAKNMTSEQKKKLLDMAKLMFKEEFDSYGNKT